LIQQLESDDGRFGLKDLKEILEQNLPALEQDCHEMICLARRQVLASQIRYNMASCIVEALGDQGFELLSSEYEDQDMRKSYQVALANLEGCQIVVRVSPANGSPGKNVVSIETQNYEQRSEHELRQRARELAHSLQNYGLSVSSVEEGALPNHSIHWLQADPTKNEIVQQPQQL
jgi:hypothetical protein